MGKMSVDEVTEGLTHEQKERFFEWQRQIAEEHQTEVISEVSKATLGSLFALIPFAVYFTGLYCGPNDSWFSYCTSFIASYACVSFLFFLLSLASKQFNFFSNKISAVVSVIICILASIAILF